MKISSSVLLRSGALLTLGLTWIYAQDEAPLVVQKLEPDFFIIEGTSNGAADAGNVGIYVTDEGVILVDDRFDVNYRQVLAAIKSVTAQPVRYVVNTHHHGDHTGGNADFLKTRVEIAAHVNARTHMVEGKMPGLPGFVFSKEASLFLGGKEVRMYYNGRGHTDGDIAVYLPAHKTVMLGDLMAGTRGVTNPVMDYANGGSLVDWPATLDGVLKLDIERVVPGHGTVGGKAELLAHRNKIEKVKTRALALVKKKTSQDDLSKALVSEFDFKPINLRAVEPMMAELSRPGVR